MLDFYNTIEATSPLDQFIIRDFLSINAPVFANLHIAITNMSVYLTIATFIVLTITLVSNNYNKIIPNG